MTSTSEVGISKSKTVSRKTTNGSLESNHISRKIPFGEKHGPPWISRSFLQAIVVFGRAEDQKQPTAANQTCLTVKR